MNDWRGGEGRVIVQQAARFPEVGVGSAVAGVKQPGQFPEVAVFLIVQLLVHLAGRRRQSRVGQRRDHGGGGQGRRGQRQMHARGKQRVNKAAGVAGQDIARPVQRPAPIGPVPNYGRAGGGIRPRQQPGRVRGGGDLRFQKAARAQLPDAVLSAGSVHHRAHAGPAVAQGNVPQPAVRLGLNQDVAFVGGWQPRSAPVVAVHGQVAEKVIPLPQPQLARQKSALPAGVHYEPGRQFLFAARAAVVPAAHGDSGSGVVKDDAGGRDALARDYAGLPGVVQEDGVKLRTPNLIGGWMAGVGFAEIPAPGFPGWRPRPSWRRA